MCISKSSFLIDTLAFLFKILDKRSLQTMSSLFKSSS